MRNELTSDYRIQELLMALNEGLLEADFVKAKLLECAGDHLDLILHSDGEYDIMAS